MLMKDWDWDPLASELLEQNYAFVAAFSVLLWDCLVTFNQEVKYIWRCPSRITKLVFLFCRYFTVVYFIMCALFGILWTLTKPASRTDCRAWYLVHAASICLLYMGNQLLLIRKVFELYGESTPLASALFALHFAQGAGSFTFTHNFSRSLDFDQICNARNLPNIASAIIVAITCNQCITWALILRKVRPTPFASWCLRTTDAYARVAWGLCLAAIILGSSHSFTIQRATPVYAFTCPMVVMSIGTSRYILRVEKDREAQATVLDATEAANKEKADESIGEGHSDAGPLPTQKCQQILHPPQWPLAGMSVPSATDASSTQIFPSEFQSRGPDASGSDYSYLQEAEPYQPKRNISDMAITDGATNRSPEDSSDSGSQRIASVRRASSSRASYSVSSIEIGSIHSSSSVDSGELRDFYNNTWNVGSFIAAGKTA